MVLASLGGEQGERALRKLLLLSLSLSFSHIVRKVRPGTEFNLYVSSANHASAVARVRKHS